MTITLKAHISVAWWVRWYIRALVLLAWLGVEPNMDRIGERIKRSVRTRVVAVPAEG